ncbi:22562_t:CDS:2, partial [Gigaspora rosea]
VKDNIKDNVKSTTQFVRLLLISSNTKKVKALIATLSSHFNPYPHYFMFFSKTAIIATATGVAYSVAEI